MLHYLLATSFGTVTVLMCIHVYRCHVYIGTMNTVYIHYCGALGSALEESLHVAMSCHNSDPLTCT